MNRLLRVLVILGIFFGLGISCASAEKVISFSPGIVELSPGSSQDVQILMDNVPSGMAGFNITVNISDSEIAEITAISFPSWGMLPRNSTLPSSEIWIKTVDLEKGVRAGNSKVLMGIITITGKKAGTADLTISKSKISADGGSVISPNVVTSKIQIVENNSVPPVAVFSASPTTGKSPLTVTFKDESTGSPTSYLWNFGDGTSSPAQSPNHKYTKAGEYTVSLTVNNAVGSNTKTMPNYIIVTKK